MRLAPGERAESVALNALHSHVSASIENGHGPRHAYPSEPDLDAIGGELGLGVSGRTDTAYVRSPRSRGAGTVVDAGDFEETGPVVAAPTSGDRDCPQTP